MGVTFEYYPSVTREYSLNVTIKISLALDSRFFQAVLREDSREVKNWYSPAVTIAYSLAVTR